VNTPLTSTDMRATSDQRPATSPERRNSPGFTLIEVIGVMAVMATLMAIMAPHVISLLDDAAREREQHSLQAITQGVELYLRDNKTWPPNLAALSPTYVPFADIQLTQNDRGHARYFVVHPTTSTFNNATGLTPANLPGARFLLISDVSTDANPTITNATQFDNWWNTDETATPDLLIHRGHVGGVFHLVSISAMGAGGSYRIDGTRTNSGGGTLTSRGNYHVTGTVVEFDEDNSFSPGSFAFGFTLTTDAGYQYNPLCSGGSQWHALGAGCS